jgi:hypothetical protein
MEFMAAAPRYGLAHHQRRNDALADHGPRGVPPWPLSLIRSQHSTSWSAVNRVQSSLGHSRISTSTTANYTAACGPGDIEVMWRFWCDSHLDRRPNAEPGA